jgi:hypothetical protein
MCRAWPERSILAEDQRLALCGEIPDERQGGTVVAGRAVRARGRSLACVRPTGGESPSLH